jgi:glycosyltransferase involved in cell wall biosynthesis
VPIGGTKGASIHVRGVTTALAARGHEVHVVAARSEPGAGTLSLPLSDIGFDRVLKDLQRSMVDQGSSPLLAGETYNLLLNIRAYQALADLDKISRLDALYERYSLWSWAGMYFARERGIPWILEINAPLVDEQRRYRHLSLIPVARGLERQLIIEADTIVVPAEELRSYVAKKVGRRSKVRVIPNGVDLDLFQEPIDRLSPQTVKRLDGRFVIAFLGSLKPWHGIKQLLQAFARLRSTVPSAHLLVIGEGPMLKEIETAARRLGPDTVTLCGAVPHEEVPAWLARADVGVAPYPELPGFYFSPLKIVEYLAAGLPVVASGIGQIVDLVKHERTGLIVPPGDPGALAEALARLYADRRLRARLGRRARERARQRHGWCRVAEEIEKTLGPHRKGTREAMVGRPDHTETRRVARPERVV